MFGGFCLLLFFAMPLASPWFGGVVFFVRCLLSDVVRYFSELAFFGFCLESLILAQDERWRRA